MRSTPTRSSWPRHRRGWRRRAVVARAGVACLGQRRGGRQGPLSRRPSPRPAPPGPSLCWAEAALIVRRLSIVDATRSTETRSTSPSCSSHPGRARRRPLALAPPPTSPTTGPRLRLWVMLAGRRRRRPRGAAARRCCSGAVELATFQLDDARSFEDARQRAADGDDHVRTGAVAPPALIRLFRGAFSRSAAAAPELIDDMQHRGYWCDVQPPCASSSCTTCWPAVASGRADTAHRAAARLGALRLHRRVPAAGQAAARSRRGDVAGAAAVGRWPGRARGTRPSDIDAEAGDLLAACAAS